MKNTIASILMEAARRDWMTDEEISLKKRIIKILKDDGHGHHHAAYAKRFKNFNFNLVPLNDPIQTAAISFDDGTIYLNRGFIQSQEHLDQLGVIMRHELCHNLLMHQFRMINKLNKDIPELNLQTSGTLHDLFNVLEDFEISNKKYDAEDKKIARAIWINGRTIQGLITEDYRQAWQGMTLEEMYDTIKAEIDADKVKLSDSGMAMNVNQSIDNMLNIYRQADKEDTDDFDTPSDLEKYILSQSGWGGKKLPDNFKQIVDTFQTIAEKTDPNDKWYSSEIADLIYDIKNSKPIGAFDIVSPKTGEVLLTLYTPEERALAIQCLKILGQPDRYTRDYNKWLILISSALNSPEARNFTDSQIKELYDIVNG